MRAIDIGGVGLEGSAVALGLMRIDALDELSVVGLIEGAYEVGIDTFDHADVYGDGRCEELFGAAFAKTAIQRSDVLIQTRCGIRDGFFDFSRDHIVTSVEKSLQRLRTDYLDILILHRPDTLMEPDEVASAFDDLHMSGKVRHFAVSNQNPGQIELLQASLRQPLIANQLQFGLGHTGMIDAGFNVNLDNSAAHVRDSGILEYCRRKNITVQAWSVLQYGYFAGSILGEAAFGVLNTELAIEAKRQGVSPSAVAVAWILRHPAAIQAIVGTTRVERVREFGSAANVDMTKERWYSLYRAAGNQLP
jgi:predicted oxidoreductase